MVKEPMMDKKRQEKEVFSEASLVRSIATGPGQLTLRRGMQKLPNCSPTRKEPGT